MNVLCIQGMLSGIPTQITVGYALTDPRKFKIMVRLKGFEPSRDTIPLPPQGSASANSAIAARGRSIGKRFNLSVQVVF